LDDAMTRAAPDDIPESVAGEGTLSGRPGGAAGWRPTTEEHQSLLALLGSDGSHLDGLSEVLGEDVLPYVVKAQCLELTRLGTVVADLRATSTTMDAMLAGVLGVALGEPKERDDVESRRLIENIYQVGARLRSRIEMLEQENTALRIQLDAVAGQLAGDRPRVPADRSGDPVVIRAAGDPHH
jgi:hypothetical protein